MKKTNNLTFNLLTTLSAVVIYILKIFNRKISWHIVIPWVTLFQQGISLLLKVCKYTIFSVKFYYVIYQNLFSKACNSLQWALYCPAKPHAFNSLNIKSSFNYGYIKINIFSYLIIFLSMSGVCRVFALLLYTGWLNIIISVITVILVCLMRDNILRKKTNVFALFFSCLIAFGISTFMYIYCANSFIYNIISILIAIEAYYGKIFTFIMLNIFYDSEVAYILKMFNPQGGPSAQGPSGQGPSGGGGMPPGGGGNGLENLISDQANSNQRHRQPRHIVSEPSGGNGQPEKKAWSDAYVQEGSSHTTYGSLADPVKNFPDNIKKCKKGSYVFQRYVVEVSYSPGGDSQVSTVSPIGPEASAERDESLRIFFSDFKGKGKIGHFSKKWFLPGDKWAFHKANRINDYYHLSPGRLDTRISNHWNDDRFNNDLD